jgi:uncharacterized MAPEG superfamily protein
MLASELTILAVYGLIVAIVLGLKTTGMIGQLGMGYVLSARDEKRDLPRMLARIDRALNNSVTALILVAIPILILGLTDRYSGKSLLAAQVFLVARLLYFPAYAFGINGIRTALWLIAFAATLVLYALAV